MTAAARLGPPGEEDRWSRRWLLASVVVLSAHAVLLYWLVASRVVHAPEGLPPSAVMIDLPPLPVEVPAEAPPEPQVVEPELMPQPEPEVAEPEPVPETPLVVPEPPKVERPAVVVMPRPTPKAKPTPKPQPTPKQVEAPHPTAHPTKPVVQRAAPSRPAAVGSPGAASSASSAASSASWHALVAAHIRRHKPAAGQDHGTVVVSFTVDRGGRVVGARVSSSSGSSALDSSALAMIYSSNPVPAPPSDVPGSHFPFSIPVNYH